MTVPRVLSIVLGVVSAAEPLLLVPLSWDKSALNSRKQDPVWEDVPEASAGPSACVCRRRTGLRPGLVLGAGSTQALGLVEPGGRVCMPPKILGFDFRRPPPYLHHLGPVPLGVLIYKVGVAVPPRWAVFS